MTCTCVSILAGNIQAGVEEDPITETAEGCPLPAPLQTEENSFKILMNN